MMRISGAPELLCPSRASNALRLLLCLVLLPAGCSRVVLDSQWPKGDVTIDGSLDEWKDQRTATDGEQSYIEV